MHVISTAALLKWNDVIYVYTVRLYGASIDRPEYGRRAVGRKVGWGEEKLSAAKPRNSFRRDDIYDCWEPAVVFETETDERKIMNFLSFSCRPDAH